MSPSSHSSPEHQLTECLSSTHDAPQPVDAKASSLLTVSSTWSVTEAAQDGLHALNLQLKKCWWNTWFSGPEWIAKLMLTGHGCLSLVLSQARPSLCGCKQSTATGVLHAVVCSIHPHIIIWKNTNSQALIKKLADRRAPISPIRNKSLSTGYIWDQP